MSNVTKQTVGWTSRLLTFDVSIVKQTYRYSLSLIHCLICTVKHELDDVVLSLKPGPPHTSGVFPSAAGRCWSVGLFWTRELLIMYINQEEAGRRIFIPSVVPCQCCCRRSCEARRERQSRWTSSTIRTRVHPGNVPTQLTYGSGFTPSSWPVTLVWSEPEDYWFWLIRFDVWLWCRWEHYCNESFYLCCMILKYYK